ncbi:undecaprenyl-phosphate glucose phosphotransferase [Flavihumibacter sp. R14]|nr:undecaprenyl-phosphate glucose phosphotransferase [Flavihumibacter soli]
MQTRYLYLLRIVLGLSDLALLNLCYYTSLLYARYTGHPAIEGALIYRILLCNFIWLLCSGFFRLYSINTVHSTEAIYRATWRAAVLHLFVFGGFLMINQQAAFSGLLITIFYTGFLTSLVMSRFTGTAIEMLMMRHFAIRKKVAVMGKNSGALRLASYLEGQNNIHFHGFLGEENILVDANGELNASAMEQLVLAASTGVEEVFVSLPYGQMGDVPVLMREAERQCVRLKVVPDMSSAATSFKLSYLGGFPVLSVRTEPLEEISSRVKKRLFDVVFSILVIVFIISWLYPLLALFIKLQSPGPVLFRQLRSGRDNKPFWCYKFRSMHLNADSDRQQAQRNDPRVTPIGRFMRRTSLDEFPQFFNVLFGNMSIVGPRPHMVNQTEQYRGLIDQYMVRQFLKPGITGWAQVNGLRGETKEVKLMRKRVEHDIWYMENWSAMLDVRIVFITIISVLKGEENAF